MLTSLFIGTHNAKKLNEIKQIVGEIKVYSFDEFRVEEVEETGSTLEENAILKAKFYFEQVQMPCLSDDTGLIVEILGGEPGVYSARYAGSEGNSTKNIQKLLRKLNEAQANSLEQRKAFFKTIIAFFDGAKIFTFEGVIHGTIAFEPKGNYGFGYDPVFIPENHTQTFAEMSPEQKNSLSHRALALKKFQKFLTTYH